MVKLRSVKITALLCSNLFAGVTLGQVEQCRSWRSRDNRDWFLSALNKFQPTSQSPFSRVFPCFDSWTSTGFRPDEVKCTLLGLNGVSEYFCQRLIAFLDRFARSSGHLKLIVDQSSWQKLSTSAIVGRFRQFANVKIALCDRAQELDRQKPFIEFLFARQGDPIGWLLVIGSVERPLDYACLKDFRLSSPAEQAYYPELLAPAPSPVYPQVSYSMPIYQASAAPVHSCHHCCQGCGGKAQERKADAQKSSRFAPGKRAFINTPNAQIEVYVDPAAYAEMAKAKPAIADASVGTGGERITQADAPGFKVNSDPVAPAQRVGAWQAPAAPGYSGAWYGYDSRAALPPSGYPSALLPYAFVPGHSYGGPAWPGVRDR